MLQPRDWTLLVIAAAEGAALEPVQLQKSLFLLSRNLSPAQLRTRDFYEFSAYDYGPFAGDVYRDAELLEGSGLVAIQRPPVSRYKRYGATQEGLARAKQLRFKLEPEVREYLDRMVTWTRRLSFNELVSAIYKKYPEMRENSVFQE